MEIRFQKKNFSYNSGEYLYICVPVLSRFQWHPFTISSAPQEGFTSLHIKLVGDWTCDLANLLKKIENPSDLPEVLIDGPYGAPSGQLPNYDVAAFVTAGIGVTPAASILKSIWFAYMRKSPMKLKKLYFVWIVKEKDSFEWFQSLLATLEKSVPKSFLEIHVYLTEALSVDDIHNIALNDAKSDVDLITELQTRCHYGRPNWSQFFSRIQKEQADKHYSDSKKALDVGIFFCGPKPLGDVLERSCLKYSDPGVVTFTNHFEHF